MCVCTDFRNVLLSLWLRIARESVWVCVYVSQNLSNLVILLKQSVRLYHESSTRVLFLCVCVCCVCVPCVLILCLYQFYTQNYVCQHVHTYIQIRTHPRIYLYQFNTLHVCEHVHTYIEIRTHPHIYIYIYKSQAYMCVHAYVRTWIHALIYSHANT